MDLSRHLLEALSKEKISSRPPGRLARPSSAQVKGFVDQFKNNTTAIIRHSGMLQLACGVVEVMNHPESKRWEKLNKDEQVTNDVYMSCVIMILNNFKCVILLFFVCVIKKTRYMYMYMEENVSLCLCCPTFSDHVYA